MSTHREQVVDLSTRVEVADQRGTEILRWLATSGWGAPTQREDYLHPGAPTLGPGPLALARYSGLAPTTTFVIARGDVWSAGGATAPATCPVCGVRSTSFEDLESWHATGVEPSVKCLGCGFLASLGDWDVESSAVLGALGVVLEPCDVSWSPGVVAVASVNPQVVAKDLLGELSGALGGRWAYVHLWV